MHEPTGTPAPDLLAAALRTLATLAATLYVRQPDGLTVVQLLSHEYDERNAILAALTGTERTQEPTGAGTLNIWRGRLAGWHLQIVQWVPDRPELRALPAPAAVLAEQPAEQPAEADPGACSCWLTSRNGCTVHHLADDQADEQPAPAWPATVDTSPATAAAEQPAGLVSSWPLTTSSADDVTQVIPVQRPPAEMLPAPSWALVGLDSTFAPLVTPGPLTDKALAGREQTAEVA